MATRLVVCGHCERHVLRSEHVCPFCGNLMPVQPRGASKVVAASVVAVAMMGCGGAQPEPEAPVSVEPEQPTEQPADPPVDMVEPVEEGELPPPVPDEEADVPPEEDGPPPAVVMYGPPPTGSR